MFLCAAIIPALVGFGIVKFYSVGADLLDVDLQGNIFCNMTDPIPCFKAQARSVNEQVVYSV